MAETTQWEYRYEGFGTLWTVIKDEELEAILNQWGEEGWEVVSIYAHYGIKKTYVLAKRPLTVERRRRRSWPG
jgi:hypothetical protein